jgi:GntR family transcriptional regulator/MocR family aminotransferase
MFLELDGQGPQYAQLIRAIKAGILNGRLTSGMRLPPTRTLALELGLSRITILTAYEQLRADGFIRG